MDSNLRGNTGLLISISFTSFIYPFMISGIAVALPSMGEHFGVSPGKLGLVETSYLAAILLLLLPVGKFADKVGLEKVYFTGMFFSIITSLLLGLNNSFHILLILRFFQGFAVAMLTSTGIAILTKGFPRERRGYVLGINIGAVYIGLSLGPFIGGIITDRLGWQYIFFTGTLLSIVALILILFSLNISGRQQAYKYNFGSALLYMLFLSLIWIGLANFQDSFYYLGILIAGLFGFILYLIREYREDNPIIDMRLFRSNQAFSLGAALTYINYASSVAVTFFFSLYLQYVKGLGPQEAGFVLITQPIIQSIFAPVSGRLSDKLNPNFLVLLGMISCFIGLLIVLFVAEDTSLPIIYGLLVFFGLGFALFSSANANQVMSSVSLKHYGMASSMVGAMRTLGMLTSISIASGMLTHFIGEQKMGPDFIEHFVDALRISFVIFSIISAIGILIAFRQLKN